MTEDSPKHGLIEYLKSLPHVDDNPYADDTGESRGEVVAWLIGSAVVSVGVICWLIYSWWPA